MTTALEKARDWLQRQLACDRRTITITKDEAQSLLAATEPIPMPRCEELEKAREWLTDLVLYPRNEFDELNAKALLAATEPVPPGEPLAERLRVPQTLETGVGAIMGAMPNFPLPEDEQPEAEALARLDAADARSDMDIEDIRMVCGALRQLQADDPGGEVVVPLEPNREITLECRVKQVPDADSTSGYRVETSCVGQQPEADPELVVYYRAVPTTTLREWQADKQACLAEIGRNLIVIRRVLQERGEQYGQAR